MSLKIIYTPITAIGHGYQNLNKAQKREAAIHAASLFWALSCPDTSGDSYTIDA